MMKNWYIFMAAFAAALMMGCPETPGDDDAVDDDDDAADDDDAVTNEASIEICPPTDINGDGIAGTFHLENSIPLGDEHTDGECVTMDTNETGEHIITFIPDNADLIYADEIAFPVNPGDTEFTFDYDVDGFWAMTPNGIAVEMDGPCDDPLSSVISTDWEIETNEVGDNIVMYAFGTAFYVIGYLGDNTDGVLTEIRHLQDLNLTEIKKTDGWGDKHFCL